MSSTDWRDYDEAVLEQLQQQQRLEGRFVLGLVFGVSAMAGLFVTVLSYTLHSIAKTVSL